MMMPTNPPLVDPKVDILLQLYEEGGAILEPLSPVTNNLLPLEMNRCVYWNESYTMVVSLIQNEGLSGERNDILYHPDCISKLKCSIAQPHVAPGKLLRCHT